MKKTAVTILKIAVSVGLYAYIFSKVDIVHLWEIVRGASLWYFGVAVLVYFAIQAVSAYRWYLLLRPLGIETGYGKLLSYYFLGMYFNFFLPTAIGGDFVRVYYLHKETKSLSRATASVFLDRDFGMGALLGIALLTAALSWTSFNGVPLAPLFALVALAFLAANLAIFFRPTYHLLHRLLRLFRMQRADERVEHLFESVNAYRGKWGLIGVVAGLSVLIQMGCVLVNVLAADAIGLRTSGGWADFLVFIPAIGLISMAPVSVNGMGWREISYIVLFQSVGATEPQALTLALLWLGVLVTTSLPGGIIYIARGMGKKDGLPVGEAMLDGAAEVEPVKKREVVAAEYTPRPASPSENEPLSTI